MRLEFAGLQKDGPSIKQGVEFAGLAASLSKNSHISLNAA